MQLAGAREQDAFGLDVGRVGDAAIYGTYLRARFMVEKADRCPVRSQDPMHR
jgi:hypothetical protein